MTTVKQIFEATLVELSKVQAPPIKLYEFNYYINKVIQQYVNKIYNMYDINQQITDDIRVLKSEAFLTPFDIKKTIGTKEIFKGSEIYLPLDYLHLLNCVCIFELLQNKNCWDKGDIIEIPAIRLTADSWNQIATDIYNKPTPLRPYYYLHNVNIQNTLPTNPITIEEDLGTGMNYVGTDTPYIPDTKKLEGVNGDFLQESITTYGQRPEGTTEYKINLSQFKNNKGIVTSTVIGDIKDGIYDSVNKTFTPSSDSIIEDQEITVTKNGRNKEADSRLSNSSNVRCEIRYGSDDKVFKLIGVSIDYLKSPQYIRFTQNQLDTIEDTSQIMEFPDYVNQEIINELVQAIMAHVNDPRLATTVQINQSIARPTQQQAQPNK